MNSLSGAEHKDEEWWDASRGRKQKGLAGQQGQPWNATPPPMGWYFIHPRGLKKDTQSLSSGSKFQERCSLTSQPVQPSEAGVQRLNPSGTVRRLEETKPGSGAGLGSSHSHTFVCFQLCLSSSVDHHNCHSHFLHYQRPLAGCTDCPVHPLIYSRFPLLFFNARPYISCVLN